MMCITAFTLMLFTYRHSYAAEQDFKVSQYTTENGLPENSIRTLLQDSRGIIWIGTVNRGLCWFDGQKFVQVLDNQQVNTITEDRNGHIWISTLSDATFCFNYIKGSFEEFSHEPGYVPMHKRTFLNGNDVWLWDYRLGCMVVHTGDGQEMRSTRYSSELGNLPGDRMSYIERSNDGRVWLGTRNGLAIVGDDDSAVILDDSNYFFSFANLGGIDYHITSDGRVFVLSGDRLEQVTEIGISGAAVSGAAVIGGKWLLQTNMGSAFLFDPSSLSFSKAPEEFFLNSGSAHLDNLGYRYFTNQSGTILYIDSRRGRSHRIQISDPASAARNGERIRIFRSPDDRLWISARNNGLYRYDLRTESFRKLDLSPKIEDSQADLLLYSIYDKSGHVWAASEFSGLFKLSRVSEGTDYLHFRESSQDPASDMVRMVTTLSGHEILIGTGSRKTYTYSSDLKYLRSTASYPSTVFCAIKDSHGQTIVGTNNSGLFIGDANYTAGTGPESICGNDIYCVLEDNSGRIWAGSTDSGLSVGTRGSDGRYAFRSFFTGDSQMGFRSLAMDPFGHIWAGTEQDGVFVFSPDDLANAGDNYRGLLMELPTVSKHIEAVMRDSKGRMWVAETGHGVSMFSGNVMDSYSREEFTGEKGLLDVMVHGLAEDKRGSIWAATSNGVSCIIPENGAILNHVLSSRLQGNQSNFGTTMSLPDGRIVTGTNEGLAIINPVLLRSKTRSFSGLRLTGFEMNGAPVRPGDEDYPGELAIGYLDKIVLPYSKRSFSLSFSALDFEPDTRYTYMLEGYDKTWSPASASNTAYYKNVAPGRYVFTVKVSGAPEDMEGCSISLPIKVKAPFFASPASLVIYLLILIVGIIAAMKTVQRMSKLKAEADMEKKLSEYKATFFTNVSHEFRTPLTLILNSIDDVKAKHGEAFVQERSFKVMEKGASRLSRLVDQLLEFNKFNENKQNLKLESGDVIAFLKDIYSTFEEAAAGKRLAFTFTSDKESFEMPFDKSALDKIAFNLISNAIKYTPDCESVAISITTDGEFCMKVTDTGIGVAEEKRDSLFDRYVDGGVSSQSMGIGLNLTKSLVENHKGTISYRPNPLGGSIFSITLPCSETAYSEGDFLVKTAIISDEDYVSTYEKPINPQKLLVIEDDNDIRSIIKDALSEYFNIITACDGESGLKALEDNQDIELVVSDIMMPGMSGYEVTEKIKGDFATCHIPVILLTALSAPEDELEGARCGADSYITKPFSKQFILTRIMKLLEQRSKIREKFSSDLSTRSEAICNNKLDREFMDKVDAIMEEHLEDSSFSVDDFAREMSMGRTAFYSKVNSVTGYSPNNYIRIIRLKKAAELLTSGRYTAAEVAYKVGIKDASYFSKLFKDQFGKTPKEYQNQAAR